MEQDVQHKHAIVLLVKQIMDQIDEIASLKRQGLKASISMQLLKEMCSILPELSETQQAYYHEVMVTLSQSAGTTTGLRYNKDYAEYTANSKRRFLSKIRGDLNLAANS